MTGDEGIHRTVSNYVLNYIPLTPMRPQMSEWPLGFMTKRCKEDFERLELEQIDESDFTDSELEVSGRLFGWKKEIDDQVRKAIQKEKWGLEDNLSKSKLNRPTFYPPLVIRSKSGYGKSILFGKILAELIDAKYSTEQVSDWPVYSRIVYSQLKDQVATTLEEAICQGMDGFHRSKNLNEFFEATEQLASGEKILFIDSLDEHPRAIDWWEISLKLSDYGWRVVWACRDPDWSYLALGDGKEDFYKPSDKNPKPHWNRFTGLTWDLEIPPDREKRLEKSSGVDWEENNQKNKKFLVYAYSTTQLMHMFHTNLRLVKGHRENLDQFLIKALIKSRDRVVEDNRTIRSNKANLDKFNNAEWYNQFFESNLAKIIIKTSIQYIAQVGKDENDEQILEDDAWLIWKLICKRYFEEHHDKRQIGQLNERIIQLETNDIIRLETNSNINIIQATKLKNLSIILLDYLHAFGILRESDGEKKFRHRDFAVIAYVEGSPMKLGNLDKEDTIFSYFFPHPQYHAKSSSRENVERIEDFLRRTGNVTSQIESLWTLPEIPPDLHKIAIISIDRFLMKPRAELPANKGISPLQRKSIELRRDKSAIVLHGVPGSGKTFSGVERILFRQAKQYSQGAKDSYALVVSLNDELAKSIKEELNGQHKNSPFLENFTQFEKDEIIGSIEVKSIKQILEEWMPLAKVNKDPDWLISHEYLRKMFDTLRERPRVTLGRSMFRLFQYDYQNNMFDLFTGMFLDVDKYIEQSGMKASVKPEILRQWHEIVSKNRENGKIPLQEACAFLRNQLLNYEFEKSYATKFNNDYKTNSHFIDFDSDESFAIFQEKFQNGYYDCIMIDEVQDLPVIAVNMLSFLSPSREPNRFILSGDKYQTLNGQNFDWYWYLECLTRITDQLIQDHSDFIFQDVHHLKGLRWNDKEIREVIDNRLDENFRNHPDISALTMYAWQNWPSEEYYKTSNEKENYRFTEMKSRFKRKYQAEFTPVMIIDSRNKEDFVEKIKTVLESISARSGVSLLCSNQNLREYVRTEFMGAKSSKKLAVETFDPWTIKGLERNAVVILGGYSVSPDGEDTQEIYDIDFSRKNEYSHYNDVERKAIDLMRRKMLVSQTRAVEQLIILKTPLNEIIQLGGQETSMKSVNTMDYSEVSKICQLKHVKELSKLQENLAEFFKASKIKDIHISIKRISEGLKLKNRSGSESVKKEYPNYMQSLTNILAKDVPKSELRRLLSRLTGRKQFETLSEHELLVDLMLLESKNRSYFRKFNDDEFILLKYDNHYSKMVAAASYLQEPGQGPWSKNGFELLRLVMTCYELLSNDSIAKVRKEFEKEYRDTDYSSILDDIIRVLDAIDSLVDDFSKHHKLPSSAYANSLLPYLLSTENQLTFGSYPQRGINDPIFGGQILENLQNQVFGVSPSGDIILTFGNDRVLTVVGDTWIKLLGDLIKLHGNQQEEGKIAFVNFSRMLTQTYIDITQMLEDGLLSPDAEKEKLIERGSAISIANLMNLGQQSEIDRFRPHIFGYISKEFPGMTTSEIIQLLEDVKDYQKEWLNDYISDNTVLSWGIQNFVIFAELLNGMANQARFQNRAVELYNSSGHVRDWLTKAISVHKPLYKIAEELHKTADPKRPYMKIMHTFISQISKINRSSTVEGREIENLSDVLVFRQTLELTNESFETIFGDEVVNLNSLPLKTLQSMARAEKIEQFSNMEKRDLVNTLKGLPRPQAPYSLHEYFGFTTKITDQVLRSMERKQLDKIKSDLVSELTDLLERFELNPNFLEGNSGKVFIRKLLFLQGICSDTIKIDENLQKYPSLHKLNVFELERIIDQPQHFMPSLPDAESEQSWSKNNRMRLFYPIQKDPLSQLILADGVLENWELNFKLHEILSTLYEPAPHQEESTKKIYWNNDGFGEVTDYSSWLAKNNEFYDYLQSSETEERNNFNDNQYYCALHYEFNLDSRIQRYLKLIQSIENAFESRSGAQYVSFKQLLRDIVLDLFDLINKAKEIAPGGKLVEFKIFVLPTGKPLTIEVSPNGTIAESEVQPWHNNEFVNLVFDLVGSKDESGRLSITPSLESLNYHKKLFNQFLNRHRKETEELLAELKKQGNAIIDDSMQKYFQDEVPSQQTHPVLKQSDELPDLNDTQHELKQEELLDIDDIAIDDNSVEILDIDDIDVDDDSEVKSRLQISDEKWNSFSETEREQARELYERLK